MYHSFLCFLTLFFLDLSLFLFYIGSPGTVDYVEDHPKFVELKLETELRNIYSPQWSMEACQCWKKFRVWGIRGNCCKILKSCSTSFRCSNMLSKTQKFSGLSMQQDEKAFLNGLSRNASRTMDDMYIRGCTTRVAVSTWKWRNCIS